MLSFLSWCTCKTTVLFLRMKRFVDKLVEAYFFGPPCISVCATTLSLSYTHIHYVDWRTSLSYIQNKLTVIAAVIVIRYCTFVLAYEHV